MHINKEILLKMPKAKNSQYAVLSQLKELSNEADCLTEQLPPDSAVDAWLASVVEAVYRIRDCTSVENIEYPSEISSIFGKQHKVNKSANEISAVQKEHVHANKHLTSSEKAKNDENDTVCDVSNSDVASVTSKSVDVDNAKAETTVSENANDATYVKIKNPVSGNKLLENQKTSNHTLLSTKKVRAEPPLNHFHTPKINIPLPINKKVLESSVSTPVLDKTFNKTMTCNKTILLDSKKCKDSFHTPLKVLEEMKNHTGMKTRSGSKRKSSTIKNKSNKKQKIDVCDKPSTSSTKAIYPKSKVARNICSNSAAVVVSENKAKIAAVIIPTLQIKQAPVINKGSLILEEIKKKEEKANENRKKVLAERQLKAEESKKKRQEKQEKTLQKRLEMEKNKEIKRDIETKSLVTKDLVKKTGLKTRVKELIEQNKEKKSGVLAAKQSEMNSADVQKTPVSQKSSDSENYDITPLPDSSTYDYSDDDDKPSGKPIPLWAQGVHLKSALIQQYYNPPNTDVLFGQYVDTPDLTEIFSVQSKRYKMRTSSAIWNSPPEHSLVH